MPKGRNARVVRFTVRIDESLDERLNNLADHMGQSKAVTAGVTIAAGLGLLEELMYRSTPDQIAAAAEALMKRLGPGAQVEVKRDPVSESK